MHSRRQMLQNTAVGFGHLALASLLNDESYGATSDPLIPKTPHFTPRAKRVVFLLMVGGPSAVDTFDYKPKLQADDGKPFPFEKPRVQFAPTGNLLKSPWKFAQHGQSGLWVSELFPNVAKHVDDLCVLSSCHGTNAAHGGALMKLHTGSDNFVRPSMGSWVSYGSRNRAHRRPGALAAKSRSTSTPPRDPAAPATAPFAHPRRGRVSRASRDYRRSPPTRRGTPCRRRR